MDFLHSQGFSKLAAALDAKLSDTTPRRLRTPPRQYVCDCDPSIVLMMIGRRCYLYTEECPGLQISRASARGWLWLIRFEKSKGTPVTVHRDRSDRKAAA